MAKFKVGDIVKPKAEKALWTFGAHLSKILELEVLRTRGDFMDVRLKKATGEGKKYEQHIFEFVRQDNYNLVSRKQELHVTSDDTTTHAVLKEGGKVVKRAKAVCSPDDEYSFETGARLAVDRVFGKDEKSAEEEDAAYEPKPKFNIGNMVKVVESGRTYCLYEDIMQQYGADYLMRWAYGVTAPQDGQYEVVQRNKHPDLKIMLYVIERKDGYSHPLYIISEDGLTKAW